MEKAIRQKRKISSRFGQIEKFARNRRVSKNKKGVSSLFISIYIALLSITLMSTIFLGIELSRSSTTEFLKLEQDRMQEEILIYGPGGMRPFGSDAVIGSIRVNNTGSIAVKIRAFYIGQDFVCDPSDTQDTYIAPKESKWINLIPFQVRINDTILRAQWTLVTERGTTTSEIGGIIWLGDPDDGYHNTNEFYIGPLMILFDKFQWKTGGGHWETGWTIPKQMNHVTWRIMMVNIDSRTLTINDESFFDLTLNDNEPKEIRWYISEDQERTLVPWTYHYIEFSLDTNGNLQDMSGFVEDYTCINLLTFTGYFDDGASFGQTIPFEAVLVTTSQTVTVTANPTSVRAGTGSQSESVVTATVVDGEDNPVPNQLISFTSTMGTLSLPLAVTDNNGVATVTFIAGVTPGDATITAEIPGMSDSTIVQITSTVATVSMFPIAGEVGKSVTVSGTNYLPYSAITITYDGITVAATTATNTGAIPSGITFIVPPSTNGQHIVRARDTATNQATATLIVTSKISIQPTSGPSGVTLVVSGHGFASSSALVTTFVGSPMTTIPASPKTDVLGSFSGLTFIVPFSANGAKIVRVTDASGNYDMATFNLGTRSITLNPTSATAGTPITVTGSNYLTNSPITVMFDSAVLTTTPPTVTSSETGTFTASFVIPASSAGTHTISASDSSANYATTTLIVAAPSISIAPTNGVTGSSVTVSGSNFAPNSIVTIEFGSTVVVTSTVSSLGLFTASFNVPDTTVGTHTIVATDDSANQNMAQTTFTVNPSISISPQTGKRNSNNFIITVTGQDFASSSTITITFDGVVRFTSPATVTTYGVGSFSATFTMRLPNDTQGHTVRASDSSGNSAAAIFTTTS